MVTKAYTALQPLTGLFQDAKRFGTHCIQSHTSHNFLSGYLHEFERFQRSPHLKPPLLQVLAQEGDRVEEGDSLVVLEAMKMEHTVRAPCGGVVTALAAMEGAQVSDGVTLAFIDAGQPATASAAGC